MNPVAGQQAMVRDALGLLSTRSEAVRRSWNDNARTEFDRVTMVPLTGELERLGRTLDTLGEALRQVLGALQR